ncbi:hypothetical protein RIR_jg33025.t1 [Rhizophagus irregularis DAOM 181602=DAOM 197198]|nr:hypothetical protein RIR_jg33025.t1 [Rhizophagus irregularis DAOM 181602=DAOM 197198]
MKSNAKFIFENVYTNKTHPFKKLEAKSLLYFFRNTTNINYYREAHLIKKEELGDELLEEPRELVSDSLVELASDSLDTLCWSKLDL